MEQIIQTPNIESNVDSNRLLASIQIISALDRHPNADRLQLATILGWQIVVRQEEVQVNQKVIFCEIDSLLPVNANWLPLAVKDRIVRDNIKDIFHVKTIKLRGEISQGLIVPLLSDMTDFDIDTNVAELLNITKYEPPTLSGQYSLQQNKKIDDFPSHLIKKSDEHRIQSKPKYLTVFNNKPYYMSVKMDGTSVTYLIDPSTSEFLVCSHNMKRDYPTNVKTCPYWQIAQKYELEDKLRAYPYFAIQGEICGPNVQKNLSELKELQFFAFTLVNITTGQRSIFEEFINFCETINIPTVPIEERGNSFNYTTVKELLAKARGMYKDTNNAREGLVVRTIDSLLSFKVINNDYL